MSAMEGLVAVGDSFLPVGNEFLTIITHIIVGKWINMAAAVVVVYEWFITLDMEIQYIWYNNTTQKPGISTKVFFLLNRYGMVIDLVFDFLRDHSVDVELCSTILQVSGAATVFGTYASEYILALRVCAIWKMNRIVIFCLAITYIGKVTYTLMAFYSMLRAVKFFTLLPLGGCLANTHGSTMWILYTLLSIYDTAMVILMVYPTIRNYKSFYGRTKLVRHVYDEGVIFYVFLLLVDIVSVALQETVRDNIFFFPSPARLLRSILATRTILHLREISSQEVRVRSTVVMSNLRFHRSAGEETEV